MQSTVEVVRVLGLVRALPRHSGERRASGGMVRRVVWQRTSTRYARRGLSATKLHDAASRTLQYQSAARRQLPSHAG